MRDAFLVVSLWLTQKLMPGFLKEGEVLKTFCNAVDDIEHCNCYASAVVRRGPLQIAISTAGKSPALAQSLRQEWEEQFGEEYAPWVTRLGEIRSRLFQDKALDGFTRRKILQEQASASAFESFRDSLKADGNRQKSGEDSEG